jgi:predicted XRE-type DNA-binding protein
MARRITSIDGIPIRQGSDNVYADLGLKDSEKLQVKSGLVIEISRALGRLKLTQTEAAQRMGIPQPRVSGMLRGDFSHLSERKLMECLRRLGYDIEIRLRPTSARIGRLRVAAE